MVDDNYFLLYDHNSYTYFGLKIILNRTEQSQFLCQPFCYGFFPFSQELYSLNLWIFKNICLLLRYLSESLVEETESLWRLEAWFLNLLELNHGFGRGWGYLELFSITNTLIRFPMCSKASLWFSDSSNFTRLCLGVDCPLFSFSLVQWWGFAL